MKKKIGHQELFPDWEAVPFRDIAEIHMGQSPDGNTYNTEGRGVALINGPTEFTDYSPIKIQWTSKPTKLCQQGDILFCVRGSSTGRMNVADDVYCIGRGVAAIRANHLSITSFLRYELEFIISKILGLTAGSTFPNIDKASLGSFEVFLPSLAEQRKIVEILSTWNTAIHTTEQLLEAKQQLKKGLMQRLLTGKLRLIANDDKKRRIVALKDILAKIYHGGTPSTQIANYWEGHIPWITGADIVDSSLSTIRRYITEEAVLNSATNVVPENCILVVTRTGVGKIAIAPTDMAISQDITAISVDETNTSIMYLFYYLLFTVKKVATLTQGTSISGITRDILMEWQIGLPPLPEQQKIASVLSACDREIELLREQLEQYKQQKKGLMQQLLTGRVRVQVGEKQRDTVIA